MNISTDILLPINFQYALLVIGLVSLTSLGMSLYCIKSSIQNKRRKPMLLTSDSSQEKTIELLQSEIQEVKDDLTAQVKELHALDKTVPHVALIRYNPFRDSGVGGNQSFSLAHINGLGNGSIITHLFSREMSRVSTKQIKNWESDIELSPEEKQVLNQLRS